ncbi:hypothetical protein ABVF61_12285 [Roseibium sp. HPY-6]|uniref:hypothetical protein n=1 Tax=Roseibium sp. HPY-6 TaxID=3229852 RepID=UPI00338E352B
MSGQDEPKGGISSFSVGLGSGAPRAVAVVPPPPFRVLIAGDFGFAADTGVIDATGLDVEEILERNRPDFLVRAPNGLGSHPSEIEERISFEAVRDLRPATIAGKFRFFKEVDPAKHDADRLSEFGQLYDKVIETIKGGSARLDQADQSATPASAQAKADEAPAPGDGAADGLDALFSMIDTPASSAKASDNSDVAKAAVDAFVRKTLREESQDFVKPAAASNKSTPVDTLLSAQCQAFFGIPKLWTVIENWQSLKLLLSELEATLPFELHLQQLDSDQSPEALDSVVGGYDGVLQAELYDVVLFANKTGVSGQGADGLKTITRACAESDTVGLVALEPDFAGVPGENLAGMEAPHQLLDEPGYEVFQGLRESDAASHVALFWNEARLYSADTSWPAVFASGAWIALARILAQLEREVFPSLPVGVPTDFDALEVEESLSMGKSVATATRYLAGPGAAPSLAQFGINVLEGVANRTSLVFRRGVTLKPGKEGRGSLDQALLVSRLFSLFQEALGGALSPGQSADARLEAVTANLENLSASLSGQVVFQVQRVQAEDQDLISVAASVQSGWAAGQSHSFYLPAEG